MKATIGTDIDKAAEILQEGGLVAIPTETVYGLAANGLDKKAVVKIFEAKNRPSFDPLILHIGEIGQMDKLVDQIPDKAKKLTAAFWPGPLTVVLQKSSMVPDMVTSGLPSVGLRMPSHPVTQKLLSLLPFPLAAPSANPFGYISPTTADHVADQLGDKVDYILDGGPCKVGVESTIVSFEIEKPKILRLGGLELDELRPMLGEFDINRESSDNPSAPGMLSSHYSPKKKMVIGNLDELISSDTGGKFSYLSFQKEYDHKGETLSPKGSLSEAAANLFAALRRLDDDASEVIYAELVPESRLGAAINDRLRRAAHKS